MQFSNSGLNLQMQTVILLVFFFSPLFPHLHGWRMLKFCIMYIFLILSVTPFWHKSIKLETLTVGRTATLPNSTFMIGVCLPLPQSPQLDGNSSFSHNAAILLRATRCPSSILVLLRAARCPSSLRLPCPGSPSGCQVPILHPP